MVGLEIWGQNLSLDITSYQKGLDYLSNVDPNLSWIIRNVPIKKPIERNANLESLLRIIIGQQLSGSAADTIFNKFVILLKNRPITPQAVINLDADLIRTAGVSYAKIRYLKSLAQAFESNPSYIDELRNLNAEECIIELTKLYGIGVWTASIFTMFYLGHEDVFATSDATILKAISKIYSSGGVVDNDSLVELQLRWTPFKTIACMVLWSWVDAKMPQIAIP